MRGTQTLAICNTPPKNYQKFFYYFILYNRTLNNIILRIIFRISNTVLYIILYIYYIERNKKERKYRKFLFLHVSIYL